MSELINVCHLKKWLIINETSQNENYHIIYEHDEAYDQFIHY